MKVEGPNSSNKVAGAKKTAKAARGQGARFSDALRAPGSDSVEGTAGAAGGGPVSALDALLALQEVEEAGDSLEERRNKRAVQWGGSLLEGLEEIRAGLLMGSIPVDRLERLAALVSSQREGASDPRLIAILDEIELRSRVELAKLGRAV